MPKPQDQSLDQNRSRDRDRDLESFLHPSPLETPLIFFPPLRHPPTSSFSLLETVQGEGDGQAKAVKTSAVPVLAPEPPPSPPPAVHLPPPTCLMHRHRHWYVPPRPLLALPALPGLVNGSFTSTSCPCPRSRPRPRTGTGMEEIGRGGEEGEEGGGHQRTSQHPVSR